MKIKRPRKRTVFMGFWLTLVVWDLVFVAFDLGSQNWLGMIFMLGNAIFAGWMLNGVASNPDWPKRSWEDKRIRDHGPYSPGFYMTELLSRTAPLYMPTHGYVAPDADMAPTGGWTRDKRPTICPEDGKPLSLFRWGEHDEVYEDWACYANHRVPFFWKALEHNSVPHSAHYVYTTGPFIKTKQVKS